MVVKSSRYALPGEMWKSVGVMGNFDSYDIAHKIIDFVGDPVGKVIYGVGLGSSGMLPLIHTAKRANELGSVNFRDIDYNDIIPEELTENHRVIMISNSAKTLELISLAAEFENVERDFFLVSSNSSKGYGLNGKRLRTLVDYLTDPNEHFYHMRRSSEKATAATVSVVHSLLAMDAAIYALSGFEYPIGNDRDLTNTIKLQIAHNLESRLENGVQDIMTKLARKRGMLHILDYRGWGVGEEADLKAKEILRLKSRITKGPNIFHGEVGGVNPGDAVLVIGYHRMNDTDRRELRDFAKRYEVDVLTVEPNDLGFKSLNAEYTEGFEALSQLSAIHKLYYRNAMARGVNMDILPGATKYRPIDLMLEGLRFHVSRSRIRAIERKALAKLRMRKT